MISKIETKEDLAKKAKRNQIMVGVVMIGLLVVSTLGYSLMSGDGEDSISKVNEEGIDFVLQNGLWKTSLDGQIFGFQNLPSETLDVNINGSYDLGLYVGEPLYFVGSNEGISEILNNIGAYALRYQSACMEGLDCEDDSPIKNCSSNLIIFEDFFGDERNTTSVYQDENCVFISGDGVRGADAFIYKVLKII